jgi:hypothetical protein
MVTYGKEEDWAQSDEVYEELPRYDEGRVTLVKPRKVVASYDYSSDEDYPEYPEYVVSAREQYTVVEVDASRVETTRVLGIPLVKKTVRVKDKQDWRVQ